MQKKRVVLVLIMTLLVLAGIGGMKKVVEMRQEAQKERQIAFLKAHEQEMTEYVKKYSSQDGQIIFRWNTTKIDRGIAFAKPALTIKFDIKGSPEKIYNHRGYVLKVETDINQLDKINKLLVLNDPIYSNIASEYNEQQ